MTFITPALAQAVAADLTDNRAPYFGAHAYRVWFRAADGWDFDDVRADTPGQAAQSQRCFAQGWNALTANVELLK